MTSGPDTAGLLAYATGVAEEFRAKRDRIRSFVPDHNLTSGTANEIVLRDFIASLAPGRFAVAQGFICDPTQPGQVSKQCDILVYDQVDYPLVHSEGEVRVVWPESVRMAIEVKTNLTKPRLLAAIDNIRRTKQLRPSIRGVVFAFDSLLPQKVSEHLEQYKPGFPMQLAPELIFLLGRKTVFLRFGTGESSAYLVRKANDEGTLVAYLILRLLQELSTRTGVPKGQLLGAAGSILIDQTEVLAEGVRIGSGCE